MKHLGDITKLSGTALAPVWASEIEEFQIAVTKYHFGEGGQHEVQ